jgi:Domain of unknown function (DUF4345)
MSSEAGLRWLLRVAGGFILFVGCFHALLGVQGDWIIGLVPQSPVDPSLDSQNRFYGTCFLIYGILLWLGAGDMVRHSKILRVVFAVMFLGGCARLLAVFSFGWPTLQVCALWGLEIILPIIAWFWLDHCLAHQRRV